MAAYFAQGRLGTELLNQPLYGLWLLIKHSPDGDPWLAGGTLEVIIKQIAKFEGRDRDVVRKEVMQILKEKREAVTAWKKPLETESRMIESTREIGWFGGACICKILENDYCENPVF